MIIYRILLYVCNTNSFICLCFSSPDDKLINQICIYWKMSAHLPLTSEEKGFLGKCKILLLYVNHMSSVNHVICWHRWRKKLTRSNVHIWNTRAFCCPLRYVSFYHYFKFLHKKTSWCKHRNKALLHQRNCTIMVSETPKPLFGTNVISIFGINGHFWRLG